jgi:hypothetical protein
MGDFIKMKKEEIKESYKHASLKRKINYPQNRRRKNVN